MRTTEQSSNFENLDTMSTLDLLEGINSEDRMVPEAVSKAVPQIAALVDGIVPRMARGGRVFYLGAGTSFGNTSDLRGLKCIYRTDSRR